MKLKNIVILILFICCGLLAIFLVFSQISKSERSSLALSPQKGTYQMEDIFSLDLHLDTKNKEAAGTDIILRYNPVILEAIEIKKGSLFENFVLVKIEKEKGEIKISALAEQGKSFNGTGTIATIDFRSLKQGETDIVFNFQKDSTIDTNLAELGTGKNLLEKVINGHYTIR